MKEGKSLVISLFIIGLFALSPIVSVKGSRPAYALSETDEFIVNNDYELIHEETTTSGTITQYSSVWVRPSSCYPIEGPETPPCAQAFGAFYYADSDKDQYDESYYDAIRNGLIGAYSGFEEITEDVPGAGLAFLYTPSPDVYSATAYFGYKTGIYVIVAETTATNLFEIQGDYTKSEMKAVIVAIGEKAADALDLDTKKGPGFTAGAILGSLTLVAVIFRKYRNK